jgi:hypothetical protein
LKGPFIEAANNEVNLPEESPAAFEQVLLYLYRGEPGISTLGGKQSAAAAIRTYVLADMLCLESLANRIVDDFQDLCHMAVVPPCTLAEVTKYGRAAGKLKDMLLRQVVYDVSKFGWDEYTKAHPDFCREWTDVSPANAHELMRAFASTESKGDPSWSNDPCQWHVHLFTSKMTSACHSPYERSREKWGLWVALGPKWEGIEGMERQ